MAVWMYRIGGEAKLFASPADVPADEGWVDSPALANKIEATQAKVDAADDELAALQREIDELERQEAAPRKRGR